MSGVPGGDGLGDIPHEPVEGVGEVFAAGVGEAGPAETAGGLDGDGGGAGKTAAVPAVRHGIDRGLAKVGDNLCELLHKKPRSRR